MTEEDFNTLRKADKDGLLTYEFIANNVNDLGDDIMPLADILADVDRSGQFTASAARFLHAVDAERYAPAVHNLVAATIDRDRERRYLADLMQSIYGDVSETHAQQLCVVDNNFRRMYKRLYSDSAM